MFGEGQWGDDADNVVAADVGDKLGSRFGQGWLNVGHSHRMANARPEAAAADGSSNLGATWLARPLLGM